jgi:glycosyltransferase involved in cell wall biosynthesis
MKVLHVESGRHLYGGALQVVFLLRGLTGKVEAQVLACPEDSAVAQAAAGAARVVTMAMGGDADLGMVARLRALIRRERPDVVHLHSRRGSDLWGGIAARLEGVPCVLSRRVDNPEPRAWVALKYRLYDRVIGISRGIVEVLRVEGVPERKLVCVHSAVDTERYRPDGRDRSWLSREFGVPPDAPAIAMIAQFIARKGHASAVAAMPAVLARHPHARLLLFGQGPLEGAVRAQVRALGLEASVIFAGFRNDLDRVLPNLDLVVHPAEMEGLGVSLLQAAACGLPIVAARAGGIPEVVRPGVNGELVAPGEIHAIASHLQSLIADAPLRQRYGEAGRRLVVDEFSIDAMVEGNHAVYREVLRARGRVTDPAVHTRRQRP